MAAVSTQELNSATNVLFWLRLLLTFGLNIGIIIWGVIYILGSDVGPRFAIAGVLGGMGAVLFAALLFYIVPEKVRLDQTGIEITRGPFASKKASWEEITGVHSTLTLVAGSYRRSHPSPVVIVTTRNWKYKIKGWRHPFADLKELYGQAAGVVFLQGGEIYDELGWLPAHIVPTRSKADIHMEQYRILAFAGFVMIVAAGPCLLLVLIHWGLVILGPALGFIGLMCLVAGVLGYFDEKKKAGI